MPLVAGLFRRSLAAFVAAAATAFQPAAAATVDVPLREPGVVWISDGRPGAAQRATMRNVSKSFVPDLLVVPAGSTVQFPNDDPFFHSVYSASPADPFDIGYYSTGPGKIVAFDSPGVVAVACHIHRRMRATIVVVDGPWALGTSDARVAGVPPGTYVVHAYDATYGERRGTVRVAPGAGDVFAGTL